MATTEVRSSTTTVGTTTMKKKGAEVSNSTVNSLGGGDTLARSGALQIRYVDPDNVWYILESVFYKRLPFPITEWIPPVAVVATTSTTSSSSFSGNNSTYSTVPSTTPSSTLSSFYDSSGTGTNNKHVPNENLIYILPSLTCAFLPDTDKEWNFVPTPPNWYRTPYSSIYIFTCETMDEYKSKKATLSSWVNEMITAGEEWFIVYIPLGTHGRTQSMNKLTSFFSSTFGSNHKNNATNNSGSTDNKRFPSPPLTINQSIYKRIYERIKIDCLPQRKYVTHLYRLDQTDIHRRMLGRLMIQRENLNLGPLSSTLLANKLLFDPDYDTHLDTIDSETNKLLDEQWNEFFSKLHAAVFDSLTTRVAAYDAEIHRRFEARHALALASVTNRSSSNSTSWNFADYFVLKEGLSFVYSQIRLPQEALRCYDELEATFYVVSSLPAYTTPTLLKPLMSSFSSNNNTSNASSSTQPSYLKPLAQTGYSVTSNASALQSLHTQTTCLRTATGISDRAMLADYPVEIYDRLGIHPDYVPSSVAATVNPAVSSSLSSTSNVTHPLSNIARRSSIIGKLYDPNGLGTVGGELLPSLQNTRTGFPVQQHSISPYTSSTSTGGSSSGPLLLSTPSYHHIGSTSRWTSLSLSNPPPHTLDLTHLPYRDLLALNELSLFDFHHYLFARQATLLSLMRKTEELAERANKFIHIMTQFGEFYIATGQISLIAVKTWLYCTTLDLVEICSRGHMNVVLSNRLHNHFSLSSSPNKENMYNESMISPLAEDPLHSTGTGSNPSPPSLRTTLSATKEFTVTEVEDEDDDEFSLDDEDGNEENIPTGNESIATGVDYSLSTNEASSTFPPLPFSPISPPHPTSLPRHVSSGNGSQSGRTGSYHRPRRLRSASALSVSPVTGNLNENFSLMDDTGTRREDYEDLDSASPTRLGLGLTKDEYTASGGLIENVIVPHSLSTESSTHSNGQPRSTPSPVPKDITDKSVNETVAQTTNIDNENSLVVGAKPEENSTISSTSPEDAMNTTSKETTDTNHVPNTIISSKTAVSSSPGDTTKQMQQRREILKSMALRETARSLCSLLHISLSSLAWLINHYSVNDSALHDSRLYPKVSIETWDSVSDILVNGTSSSASGAQESFGYSAKASVGLVLDPNNPMNDIVAQTMTPYSLSVTATEAIRSFIRRIHDHHKTVGGTVLSFDKLQNGGHSAVGIVLLHAFYSHYGIGTLDNHQDIQDALYCSTLALTAIMDDVAGRHRSACALELRRAGVLYRRGDFHACLTILEKPTQHAAKDGWNDLYSICLLHQAACYCRLRKSRSLTKICSILLDPRMRVHVVQAWKGIGKNVGTNSVTDTNTKSNSGIWFYLCQLLTSCLVCSSMHLSIPRTPNSGANTIIVTARPILSSAVSLMGPPRSYSHLYLPPLTQFSSLSLHQKQRYLASLCSPLLSPRPIMVNQPITITVYISNTLECNLPLSCIKVHLSRTDQPSFSKKTLDGSGEDSKNTYVDTENNPNRSLSFATEPVQLVTTTSPTLPPRTKQRPLSMQIPAPVARHAPLLDNARLYSKVSTGSSLNLTNTNTSSSTNLLPPPPSLGTLATTATSVHGGLVRAMSSDHIDISNNNSSSSNSDNYGIDEPFYPLLQPLVSNDTGLYDIQTALQSDPFTYPYYMLPSAPYPLHIHGTEPSLLRSHPLSWLSLGLNRAYPSFLKTTPHGISHTLAMPNSLLQWEDNSYTERKSEELRPIYTTKTTKISTGNNVMVSSTVVSARPSIFSLPNHSNNNSKRSNGRPILTYSSGSGNAKSYWTRNSFNKCRDSKDNLSSLPIIPSPKEWELSTQYQSFTLNNQSYPNSSSSSTIILKPGLNILSFQIKAPSIPSVYRVASVKCILPTKTMSSRPTGSSTTLSGYPLVILQDNAPLLIQSYTLEQLVTVAKLSELRTQFPSVSLLSTSGSPNDSRVTSKLKTKPRRVDEKGRPIENEVYVAELYYPTVQRIVSTSIQAMRKASNNTLETNPYSDASVSETILESLSIDTESTATSIKPSRTSVQEDASLALSTTHKRSSIHSVHHQRRSSVLANTLGIHSNGTKISMYYPVPSYSLQNWTSTNLPVPGWISLLRGLRIPSKDTSFITRQHNQCLYSLNQFPITFPIGSYRSINDGGIVNNIISLNGMGSIASNNVPGTFTPIETNKPNLSINSMSNVSEEDSNRRTLPFINIPTQKSEKLMEGTKTLLQNIPTETLPTSPGVENLPLLSYIPRSWFEFLDSAFLPSVPIQERSAGVHMWINMHQYDDTSVLPPERSTSTLPLCIGGRSYLTLLVTPGDGCGRNGIQHTKTRILLDLPPGLRILGMDPLSTIIYDSKKVPTVTAIKVPSNMIQENNLKANVRSILRQSLSTESFVKSSNISRFPIQTSIRKTFTGSTLFPGSTQIQLRFLDNVYPSEYVLISIAVLPLPARLSSVFSSSTTSIVPSVVFAPNSNGTNHSTNISSLPSYNGLPSSYTTYTNRPLSVSLLRKLGATANEETPFSMDNGNLKDVSNESEDSNEISLMHSRHSSVATYAFAFAALKSASSRASLRLNTPGLGLVPGLQGSTTGTPIAEMVFLPVIGRVDENVLSSSPGIISSTTISTTASNGNINSTIQGLSVNRSTIPPLVTPSSLLPSSLPNFSSPSSSTSPGSPILVPPVGTGSIYAPPLSHVLKLGISIEAYCSPVDTIEDNDKPTVDDNPNVFVIADSAVPLPVHYGITVSARVLPAPPAPVRPVTPHKKSKRHRSRSRSDIALSSLPTEQPLSTSVNTTVVLAHRSNGTPVLTTIRDDDNVNRNGISNPSYTIVPVKHSDSNTISIDTNSDIHIDTNGPKVYISTVSISDILHGRGLTKPVPLGLYVPKLVPPVSTNRLMDTINKRLSQQSRITTTQTASLLRLNDRAIGLNNHSSFSSSIIPDIIPTDQKLSTGDTNETSLTIDQQHQQHIFDQAVGIIDNDEGIHMENGIKDINRGDDELSLVTETDIESINRSVSVASSVLTTTSSIMRAEEDEEGDNGSFYIDNNSNDQASISSSIREGISTLPKSSDAVVGLEPPTYKLRKHYGDTYDDYTVEDEENLPSVKVTTVTKTNDTSIPFNPFESDNESDARSNGSSTDDETDDEDSLATAVYVQAAAIVYHNKPIIIRNYSISIPSTSGWTLTTDESKYLIGQTLQPTLSKLPQQQQELQHTLETVFAPSFTEGGRTFPSFSSSSSVLPSSSSSVIYTSTEQTLQQLPDPPPFIVSFAFKFARSISASTTISARFNLSYEVVQTDTLDDTDIITKDGVSTNDWENDDGFGIFNNGIITTNNNPMNEDKKNSTGGNKNNNRIQKDIPPPTNSNSLKATIPHGDVKRTNSNISTAIRRSITNMNTNEIVTITEHLVLVAPN